MPAARAASFSAISRRVCMVKSSNQCFREPGVTFRNDVHVRRALNEVH